MIETVLPRSGTNPITGDAIVPAGMPATNPINGSEWTIKNADDLQYACIFPLPEPKDCGDVSVLSCDCKDPNNDNPLCEPSDMDATKRTKQTKAKAYPGVRELQVLRSLGAQGITASVCPAQLTDAAVPDYGYRPAIGAIVDRLKVALGGQCLPRTLTPDEGGQVPCLILEARRVEDQNVAECNKCGATGRQPVAENHIPAVNAAKEDPVYQTAKWNCFCEIQQTLNTTADGNTQTGNLNACQDKLENPPLNDLGEEVHGWCYVDATTTPITGNPEIVKNCPDTEKRIVRFVGEGGAQPGATLFITCTGE
jgi:hypothetical protein